MRFNARPGISQHSVLEAFDFHLEDGLWAEESQQYKGEGINGEAPQVQPALDARAALSRKGLAKEARSLENVLFNKTCPGCRLYESYTTPFVVYGEASVHVELGAERVGTIDQLTKC